MGTSEHDIGMVDTRLWYTTKSLSAQFTQYTNNQRYLRSFPFPVLAQQCLLVFENNDDVGSYPLETLQAISSFFCQQKATLFDHSYSEDNTIKFLYKIAKEVTVEETHVKRELSNISTDSENDLKFPQKLPVGFKRPLTTPQLAEEIAFVKRFKANVGRMNWTQCLTKAHEIHLLLRYSTGSSLRANFNTHVKDM
ncbi:hypothetical protein G6F37_007229 [Rhizopus arrhizus]|nr:hypothetical protein G6F38_011292 [Rhizopus arrhizus]KAG1156845.1 hypothetical protein G6F37_007229 [Rhizopus arrhizus]